MEKNRRMTLILSGIALLVILVMGVLVYLISQQDMLAVDKDGDIVSLMRTSADDQFKIEADNHLRLFYSRFFTYEKSTYKNQVQLGLQLGDNSVKSLYETYVSNDWYKIVVNNDLDIESYVVGEIQFERVSDGLRFFCKGRMKITRAHIVEYRHLDLSGTIRRSAQGRVKFKNPHGMKIHGLVLRKNNTIQDGE